MTTSLTELVDRLRPALPDGLTLIFFRDGVINVNATGRELVRADVDAVRAGLAREGFEELESWVATMGASWLSDGVTAGVSFRVREVPRG